MKWKIPLFMMNWTDDDIVAVNKVIKRGTFWAEGPEIKEFENKLAKYSGRKFALTFNSGTSGLHALLLSYEVEGMEVIVPSFTFISTANSILLAGGKPVFADIEEDTFGLSYGEVKKQITDHTKAVILVHYGGCPARDTLRIRDLCKENKILLIEDSAESMGAMINKEKAGTFGDSALLSFCQNKIITCGEGGAIITDDEEIYDKLKLIRSHGRVDDDYFSSSLNPDYKIIGYNLRMSSMTAALGLSQLKRIDKLITIRQGIAGGLSVALGSIDGITVPIVPNGFSHVFQLYTIRMKDKKTRDKLNDYLTEIGIMSKIYFSPIHTKSHYKKIVGELEMPMTEKVSNEVLSIPIYVDIKKDELELIISNIKKCLG